MSCADCGSNNISPRGVCRPCHAARVRAWKKKNPSRHHAIAFKSRIKCRDAANARRRGEKNRKANIERRLSKKSWYEQNKARIALRSKFRRARQKVADLDGFRRREADRARRRRAADPRRRAHEKMSRLVAKTLKRHRTSKQGRTWPSLVGYTVVELESRLMATMPSGYSWSDYLNGALEIDHIIPASVFNFGSPDDIDFKRCWALSNLRLLPRAENYTKRARLSEAFQPALPLAIARGAAV